MCQVSSCSLWCWSGQDRAPPGIGWRHKSSFLCTFGSPCLSKCPANMRREDVILWEVGISEIERKWVGNLFSLICWISYTQWFNFSWNWNSGNESSWPVFFVSSADEKKLLASSYDQSCLWICVWLTVAFKYELIVRLYLNLNLLYNMIFYLNLNLFLNMRELAKHPMPPTQVCLVVQASAMQLQINMRSYIVSAERLYFISNLYIKLFLSSHLGKSFQCGSEIVLTSIGLIQVFCVTRDITCQEMLNEN